MRKDRINVLIAYEESQAECKAFRDRGFNAYSCDIQPCKKSGRPDWHIIGDVTPLIKGKTSFKTMDGKKHYLKKWHLIIAHPPCTYLCRVGAVMMAKNADMYLVQNGIRKHINRDRYEKMKEAREFFYLCLNADAQFVAVENPIPMAISDLPKADCYIQPSWFGVKYTKKTLFWLKNLPPLFAFCEYPDPRCYVTRSRGKYRSRTFPEVANGIAAQWGYFIYNELNKK